MTAEPIRLDVDLSKPGDYRGEFHHTFVGAHGQNLEVETASGFPSQDAAAAAIEGIVGSETFSILTTAKWFGSPT